MRICMKGWLIISRKVLDEQVEGLEWSRMYRLRRSSMSWRLTHTYPNSGWIRAKCRTTCVPLKRPREAARFGEGNVIVYEPEKLNSDCMPQSNPYPKNEGRGSPSTPAEYEEAKLREIFIYRPKEKGGRLVRMLSTDRINDRMDWTSDFEISGRNRPVPESLDCNGDECIEDKIWGAES
jgi:hypothetical protein